MQKKKKKKALTLKKKAQKALQPINKSEPQKKSTKKHYGAFKSTHYDPCEWKRLAMILYFLLTGGH